MTFFINHVSAGSSQGKWYLVQLYMEQSDPVTMRNYGL